MQILQLWTRNALRPLHSSILPLGAFYNHVTPGSFLSDGLIVCTTEKSVKSAQSIKSVIQTMKHLDER